MRYQRTHVNLESRPEGAPDQATVKWCQKRRAAVSPYFLANNSQQVRQFFCVNVSDFRCTLQVARLKISSRTGVALRKHLPQALSPGIPPLRGVGALRRKIYAAFISLRDKHSINLFQSREDGHDINETRRGELCVLYVQRGSCGSAHRVHRCAPARPASPRQFCISSSGTCASS